MLPLVLQSVSLFGSLKCSLLSAGRVGELLACRIRKQGLEF